LLFVVVLVIVMLGGVGLFAAQSSLLGITTGGAKRKAAISEMAAGSALSGVMVALARSPEAHLGYMTAFPSAECLGYSGALFPPPCARFGRIALENELGISLFAPYDVLTGAHGSLGRAFAETDLLVEITDRRALARSIAGFDSSRAGPVDVRFETVLVHAEGRLAPLGAPQKTLATTTIRAEFILGPMAAH
jgi:hypothetical protein